MSVGFCPRMHFRTLFWDQFIKTAKRKWINLFWTTSGKKCPQQLDLNSSSVHLEYILTWNYHCSVMNRLPRMHVKGDVLWNNFCSWEHTLGCLKSSASEKHNPGILLIVPHSTSHSESHFKFPSLLKFFQSPMISLDL